VRVGCQGQDSMMRTSIMFVRRVRREKVEVVKDEGILVVRVDRCCVVWQMVCRKKTRQWKEDGERAGGIPFPC
jgi:hypothetical protein